MDNQVEYDHKYFISLALQNKIAWGAMPIIIEGLTPTLDKSKEVNRFLLKELEKFHVKFQSLEQLQYGNHDKVTESEPCLIKTPEQSDTLENAEAIEDDIKVLKVVKEIMNEENSQSQLIEEQNSPNVSEDENYLKSHYEREIDNEWYIFVSNDKAETQFEPKEAGMINEEIENLTIVKETDSFQSQHEKSRELSAKQTKKKQFQCTNSRMQGSKM